MAVFICTLIFKISRMHTCVVVVCIDINICVGGGGRGEGVGGGWGGVVMWVCKQEIDVRVCACLNSCIFNLSKLTCIFQQSVYVYLYIYIYSVCV